MSYNWVPIFGEFLWSKASVSFAGNETKLNQDLSGRPVVPAGLCLSDQRFNEGTITASIRFDTIQPETTAEIVLYYDMISRDTMTIGIGGNGVLFSARYFEGKTAQWKHLQGGGTKSSLRIDHEYRLSIRLRGSFVTMTLDGVDVISLPMPMQTPLSQVGVFSISSGAVYFDDIVISSDQPKAFIVMQFTPEYNELYSDVIRPVCEQAGLLAFRADDTYSPGVVISDIGKQIQEAKVVIAEITPSNPNVYYEVGFAHALGKPTILIADKTLSRLPFDISSFRTLFYENSIGGKKKIEEGLRRYLENFSQMPKAA